MDSVYILFTRNDENETQDFWSVHKTLEGAKLEAEYHRDHIRQLDEPKQLEWTHYGEPGGVWQCHDDPYKEFSPLYEIQLGRLTD